MKFLTPMALALAFAGPTVSFAESDAWADIRAGLFGERFIANGTRYISIDAPYRTSDDLRTQIAAYLVAPGEADIRQVTVIIDENPMPVSAVFDMSLPQETFFFDITMRVNGPSPLHVVMETTDGQLFVSQTYVKTSGLGACSAPPGTDPEEALATLGEMSIHPAGPLPVSLGGDLLNRVNRIDIDVDHPSHSGMQKDQISLLYVPMRYVHQLEIDLNGQDFVDMTGSISLSENPLVSLSVPHTTRTVDVTMTDTSGTVTQAHKDLTGF